MLHGSQVDLVPTVALLLGAPIPTDNVGAVLPELAAGLPVNMELTYLQVQARALVYCTQDTQDSCLFGQSSHTHPSSRALQSCKRMRNGLYND